MPHIRRYEKNFSQQTRELFSRNYECFSCGRNKWDCLHHCLGGNFEEADSVCNAIPLCNLSCHIGKHFSEEDKGRMLKKTREYLMLIGYKLTEKDKKFINNNAKYYV